jgi:hypothetical protein
MLGASDADQRGLIYFEHPFARFFRTARGARWTRVEEEAGGHVSTGMRAGRWLLARGYV